MNAWGFHGLITEASDWAVVVSAITAITIFAVRLLRILRQIHDVAERASNTERGAGAVLAAVPAETIIANHKAIPGLLPLMPLVVDLSDLYDKLEHRMTRVEQMTCDITARIDRLHMHGTGSDDPADSDAAA